MKKAVTLLLPLSLLLSCGGEPRAKFKASDLAPLIVTKKTAAAPQAPRPTEKKITLEEALALLKDWKSDPANADLKSRVAEAFLALAKDAADKGNVEVARKCYLVVAQADPTNKEARDALLAGHQGANVSGEPQAPQEPEGLKVSTFHFSVRISGVGMARTADQVVGVLEEGYLKVCSGMGVNPDGKVPVVLYTDKEFYDTTGLPPWVSGAYNGTIHLPVAGLDISNPLVKRVIVHEFVHAFNFQVTKGRCPTWLDEGLAQYFENPRPTIQAGMLLNAAESGTLPNLSSPSFLIGSRETTAALYQMALAAVQFLEHRASLAAISTFLQKIGEGTDPSQAFQDTFLFPYAQLQANTLAELARVSR